MVANDLDFWKLCISVQLGNKRTYLTLITFNVGNLSSHYFLLNCSVCDILFPRFTERNCAAVIAVTSARSKLAMILAESGTPECVCVGVHWRHFSSVPLILSLTLPTAASKYLIFSTTVRVRDSKGRPIKKFAACLPYDTLFGQKMEKRS